MISSRYSLLTSTIRTAKVASIQVTNIFLDNEIFYDGIFNTIFSDKEQQLVCLFFTFVCAYLRIGKLTNKASH